METNITIRNKLWTIISKLKEGKDMQTEITFYNDEKT